MVGSFPFRFSVLGSGSAGNAIYVEAGGVRLLVDAGLNGRQCEVRLASIGVSCRSLDAILLTHEHGDHVAHAGTLARRFGAPLVATRGTFDAIQKRLRGDEERSVIESGSSFDLGPATIEAVQKPHDASDPVAYVVRCGDAALGLFTDLGHVDGTVGEAMAGCTAIVLESNHDRAMLADGPYPAALKARVGGRFGHLSNEDSAKALARHGGERLHTVVLAHLSTTNNLPDLVRRESVAALGAKASFARWISYQERPTRLLDAVVATTVHEAVAYPWIAQGPTGAVMPAAAT